MTRANNLTKLANNLRITLLVVNCLHVLMMHDLEKNSVILADPAKLQRVVHKQLLTLELTFKLKERTER